MRGHQKAAVREWGVIVVAILILIAASAASGGLLIKIGQAWGWFA